jgi:hypothetical protein
MLRKPQCVNGTLVTLGLQQVAIYSSDFFPGACYHTARGFFFPLCVVIHGVHLSVFPTVGLWLDL